MQYHAISCNTMPYHAISCNTMQYHATPCNTMQNHASLITADGAYHCPVGSIRPFFLKQPLCIPRCKIRRENRRAFPIDFRGPKIPCTCHFNHRNLSGSTGFRIGQNMANWGLILMMLSFLLKIE